VRATRAAGIGWRTNDAASWWGGSSRWARCLDLSVWNLCDGLAAGSRCLDLSIWNLLDGLAARGGSTSSRWWGGSISSRCRGRLAAATVAWLGKGNWHRSRVANVALLGGDGEAVRHVVRGRGPCGRGLGARFCDGVGDRYETSRAQG
jgi:hypothetical protein